MAEQSDGTHRSPRPMAVVCPALTLVAVVLILCQLGCASTRVNWHRPIMAKPDPAAMPREPIWNPISRCNYEEEIAPGRVRPIQEDSDLEILETPEILETKVSAEGTEAEAVQESAPQRDSSMWRLPDVPDVEEPEEPAEPAVTVEADEVPPRDATDDWFIEARPVEEPAPADDVWHLPEAEVEEEYEEYEEVALPGSGTWDTSDLPPPEEVRGHAGSAEGFLPEELHQGPIRRETLYEIEAPGSYTPLAPERLAQAESYYIMAYDADRNLDESALNMYLDAMVCSWQYLESGPPEKAPSRETLRAWDIYHSSLARLIHIAMHNGNYDKAIGIKIPINGGYRILQTEFVGFQRTVEDFNEWHVVGKYDSRFFPTIHKYKGIGVPLVVVRKGRPDDRWFPPRLPFAATALFRPDETVNMYDATAWEMAPIDGHVEQIVGRLEIHNPKTERITEFRCTEVPLAADTTAPYAFWLKEEPPAHHGLGHGTGHLVSHRRCGKQGLVILEPHRRGKIPVVFVDGLLSTPKGWLSIANELDGLPDLADRYEIWAFEYPHDRPPLEAAAVLREELHRVIQEMDPSGFDRDLRKVVLVGTGMGGLLAKLQVIDSGDLLWQYTAYQGLGEIETLPQTREYLRQSWYFSASPHVRRIVFVGTPHDGSVKACQVLCKTASHLTLMPHDLRPMHHQLNHDNPAAFRKEMRHRFPTNVDLLHSHSLLLKGIRETPIAPHVKSHSIVARGWWSLHDGQSDGKVPLASSRLPGVDTEVMVTSKHHNLYRNQGTVCEIIRVLREHAARPPFTGG